MTELKDVEWHHYIDGKKDKGLMSDTQAYKTVLHDLAALGNGIFTGKHDELNRSAEFMYGVWSVMEQIAFGAGEYIEFADMFSKNMVESGDSALPF